MKRNDTIGIVGVIKGAPSIIVDAPDWDQRIYETELMRERPSGTQDKFILQFIGRAAVSKEMLEQITDGAAVMVGGELRSENVIEPKPEENRVKIFIYAEMIALNTAGVPDQNEVKLCGRICTEPRKGRGRRNCKEKYIPSTNIMLAVNTPSPQYIPCVCYGEAARVAEKFAVGTYVEIYGRFKSRLFKKRIEGKKIPFMCTAYEVGVLEMKYEIDDETETQDKNGKEGKE